MISKEGEGGECYVSNEYGGVVWCGVVWWLPMWVGLCVFFTWLPPWYSAGFTVRGVMVGRATRSPLLVMMMSDMPRGREVKWWSAKVVPFLALSEEDDEEEEEDDTLPAVVLSVVVAVAVVVVVLSLTAVSWFLFLVALSSAVAMVVVVDSSAVAAVTGTGSVGTTAALVVLVLTVVVAMGTVAESPAIKGTMAVKSL